MVHLRREAALLCYLGVDVLSQRFQYKMSQVIIVNKTRMVMRLASFFAICFSFFLFFVGLDRAQNTEGIGIYMNITNLTKPVNTFGLTYKTKQCAESRFLQHSSFVYSL